LDKELIQFLDVGTFRTLLTSTSVFDCDVENKTCFLRKVFITW